MIRYLFLVSLLALFQDSLEDRESESFEGTAGTGRDRDFFSHVVADHEGKKISLEKYRGKVVLVVNVASECGFTDRHYRSLVKLQDILGRSGKFQVLAFPCNQFGGQEPKNGHHRAVPAHVSFEAADVVKFAQDTYKVNFPIFNKINVIENSISDVYQYLTDNTGNPPTWNFWKYLVGADGLVLNSWGPWSDVEEIFPEVKKAVDLAVAGADPTEANGPNRPGASSAQAPSPSQEKNGIVGPPPPEGSERSEHDSIPSSQAPEGSEGGSPQSEERNRGPNFRGEPPKAGPPKTRPPQPKPKGNVMHDDL